jgi:hypothetical protein
MPTMHGSLCYDHERFKNTSIVIHKIPKAPTKSMDPFTNTRKKFHKPYTPSHPWTQNLKSKTSTYILSNSKELHS